MVKLGSLELDSLAAKGGRDIPADAAHRKMSEAYITRSHRFGIAKCTDNDVQPRKAL